MTMMTKKEDKPVNSVKILEVKLDSTSRERVLRQVLAKIIKKQRFYIVTPNPEIIVKAEKDSELKKILNSADISLPDGVGLLAADKFINLKTPENKLFKTVTLLFQGLTVGISIVFRKSRLEENLKLIKGRLMFLELIKFANKRGWKVFFLGGFSGAAKKTSDILRRNYKKIKIESSNGPVLNEIGFPIDQEQEKVEKETVEKINQFKPQLLFIGFGAPKQEKWVYRWFKKLNIGGAMVVGGTFDYISGEGKKIPGWIGKTGLEWFWRLITGSQNLGRITNAVIIFPLKVFIDKLNN